MSTTTLLRRLADGRHHSGQALAAELGVTRAAVWKQIEALRRRGLAVEARRGAGYRLARPVELLDAGAIRAALGAPGRGAVARLDVFAELDSTNRWLLEHAPPPGRLNVCLAEYQTAGRGRRGRQWHAPLGSGLCLSAAWQFAGTPAGLSALTLAVGVVARRALAATAGLAVGLKWPNDLVWDDRKLGGILLEMVAEAHGGCLVVAGLGLNVAVPAERLREISDWPGGAVDLAQATGGAVPARNVLAAALIDGLAALFAGYAEAGFAPYREEWRDADHLKGKRIVWDRGAGGASAGTAAGIDADGALLLRDGADAPRRIVAGDVSVRAVR